MQDERITTEIFESSKAASRAVADRIVDLIHRRAAEGKQAVLGLATGHTPIGIYANSSACTPMKGSTCPMS